MTFKLRPRAFSDLESIADTIASANPKAAEEWIQSAYRKFKLLAENPEMGALRDEIRQGMRVLPAVRYLIFYLTAGRDVEIVRVLHGARDLKRLFGEG